MENECGVWWSGCARLHSAVCRFSTQVGALHLVSCNTGEFPWRGAPASAPAGASPGHNGSAAAQKHYARRARAAAARLDRTLEEADHLRGQLLCTLAYYPARQQQIAERLCTLQAASQAGGGAATEQAGGSCGAAVCPANSGTVAAGSSGSLASSDAGVSASGSGAAAGPMSSRAVGCDDQQGAHLVRGGESEGAAGGLGAAAERLGKIAILRRAHARYTVMEGLARRVLRAEVQKLLR